MKLNWNFQRDWEGGGGLRKLPFRGGGKCVSQKKQNDTQSYDGSEGNMGTMSVPSRTLCLTLEVGNGDI